ncbi:MAG TPA: hypothetical protein VGV35_20675 [Bryobacteraceae bacterium]|nr:hypothetical protein [Bryobacteraceae bacterium]
MASCAFCESFPPADVKIAGDIKYGQTSAPVECASSPRYHALVFNAHSGDRVEAMVTAEGRRAEVAIADPSLNELASGTTQVTTVLPDRGPDVEAYYIVFRDSDAKPAHFTVRLKKLTEATPSQ